MEKIISPIIPLYVMIPVTAILLIAIIYNLLKNRQAIRRKLFMTIRMIIVLALIFCVNLRIMTPYKETKVNTKNLDVLFVVDNTLSMWADDGLHGNSRMEDVQDTCGRIMESLKGANFGVVQFDNYGQILAPFTQDTTLVEDAFDTMKEPDPDYATGTSLETAYDPMEELLRSSSSKEDRKTVVFFLSDGESNQTESGSDTGEDFSSLADMIDDGAVIGFGTEDGSTMRVNGEYIKNEDGERAVSKLDEDSLKSLADELGVDYLYSSDTEHIDNKTGSILKIVEDIISDSDLVTYADTYYVFLYPLMLMLIIEIYMVMRKRTV